MTVRMAPRNPCSRPTIRQPAFSFSNSPLDVGSRMRPSVSSAGKLIRTEAMPGMETLWNRVSPLGMTNRPSGLSLTQTQSSWSTTIDRMCACGSPLRRSKTVVPELPLRQSEFPQPYQSNPWETEMPDARSRKRREEG